MKPLFISLAPLRKTWDFLLKLLFSHLVKFYWVGFNLASTPLNPFTNVQLFVWCLACDNDVNRVRIFCFFSVCLSCPAPSDGWLLVIVCRDQYTVWASSSPGELMAAGSAAIEPWDQYIRPTEDADKETLLILVFESVGNV